MSSPYLSEPAVVPEHRIDPADLDLADTQPIDISPLLVNPSRGNNPLSAQTNNLA